MVGIDPALLMFAGRFLSQGGGDPRNGFGNALGAGLEAAGGVQIYRQEQDRQRKQDLVAQAESSIGLRKAMQDLQINDQKLQASRTAADNREVYINSLPPEQQALARANFGEFSKEQSKAAGRDPLKVVGRSLVDTQAEGGPESVFTGPANPTVSISNKAESARDVGIARLDVSRIEKGYAQADNARAQISMVDTLDTLNSEAFEGGFANARLQLGQLGAALGIQTEGLAETEQFNAISNQLALRIRNPDSGGGLTGSTSQRDLSFLINSIPNITQSREGRQRLIGALKAGLNRNVRVAQARAEYLEGEGSLKGFDGWVEENLPPTPNLTRLAGLSGDPDFDARMGSLGISFEDVEYTAQTRGMSVNEVIEQLEAGR